MPNMDTKAYWRDLGEQRQAKLAKACKTSPGYLYLVFSGHKIAGPKLALRLEEKAPEIEVNLSTGPLKLKPAASDFRADLFGARVAA